MVQLVRSTTGTGVGLRPGYQTWYSVYTYTFCTVGPVILFDDDGADVADVADLYVKNDGITTQLTEARLLP